MNVGAAYNGNHNQALEYYNGFTLYGSNSPDKAAFGVTFYKKGAEAEVPAEERYLFITPAGLKDIEDMDTTKSKACLSSFAKITKVPQSRFYSKVALATSGAGGYSRHTDGKNLNFLIVAKSAVLQTVKHLAPKVITPEQNQDADAWKFGYRIYGLNDVYENKVAGIYAHVVSSNPS